MDLGQLIGFGDKLAREDSSGKERTLDSLREESRSRSHLGGIAVHGDPDNPYNRGQRNWRYALVDQGAGADGKHVALRVHDGGPHCKQWNLDGKNDDGSYRAIRTSDLPGEWNKAESLRHPEDQGIHQEGRLQAHRAAHDEIYATMQDGRGNGTFRLTKNPDGAKRGFGQGDEWTLRFGPRPKGVNDFAADFVGQLKKSAGLPGIGAVGAMAPAVGAGVQTAREANGTIKSLGGVANAMQGKDVLEHGVNAFGGAAGAADLAQRAMTGLPAVGRAVTNYAPGLVKPIAGLAAKVNPAAMALNAYQAGDVALHPQARMDETENTLQHQGVVGQALTGMNNPAAAAATAIRGGARAYNAMGEGEQAQAGLAASRNAVGGGLVPMGTTPAVHPAGFVPTSTTQQNAIHQAFPPKPPSLIPPGVRLPAPSTPAPTSLKLGQGKDGKFYPPENYDVDERDEENKDRPKWTLSSGANDWEVGTTAMSVEIDQYGGTHRVWIEVDNSSVGGNDDSKLKRDEVPKVKAWGEKARATWVREAKRLYRPGEVPWKDAFWEAARSEAMEPYVKECGRERQEWVPKKADLNAELRTAFDRLLDQYGLVKRATFFHDPRVGQRAGGKPPHLDLAFFANRSTPQVLRPDLGDEPKPKAGYGDVTLQRRATPEEVAQLNAGKWLRVDEEGRTPGDPDYRITQYRLGLAKLRQQALDARDVQDVQGAPDDRKTASAFIRDRTLISLPDDVRSDIKRFVPDLRHKTAPHYGMVVRELVKKCDPHNLATARAHVKEEPISRLEKEFYAKNDGRKFVLLVNDRVVDAHHFIAKAERIGCTSSLDVLDLTGCRHQSDRSNEKKAGYTLGELIYHSTKTAGGGGDKRLSCLMAPVPRDSNLFGQLYDFAKDIAYDDLYLGDGPAEGGEYGRELEFHVTALFGLKSADPEPVKKFVQDRAPLRIKLGKLSAFEAGQGKGYDVLKFEVECEELEKLHEDLKSEFDCEISHPTYHPHCTVAYLKAGRAGKYLDRQKLRGSSFTAETLEFSDWTKKKTPCPLEGTSKKADLDHLTLDQVMAVGKALGDDDSRELSRRIMEYKSNKPQFDGLQDQVKNLTSKVQNLKNDAVNAENLRADLYHGIQNRNLAIGGTSLLAAGGLGLAAYTHFKHKQTKPSEDIKTASLDSLTYPLTGPLGASTLAATGVGAGLGGLAHLYRSVRNKITGQKPDPEENSLLGDVGRGAVLGAAANIGFKGLGGMMGGPHPVNEHPVPYETPMMANDFQPGHALGALVQRGMAPNLPIE